LRLIFDQFSDEFRRRRSVRFDIYERRIIDELLRAAVVVDDDDLLGAIQQRFMYDERGPVRIDDDDQTAARIDCVRSEEHTSELQSRENLVCRLLLEKKKKQEVLL